MTHPQPSNRITAGLYTTLIVTGILLLIANGFLASRMAYVEYQMLNRMETIMVPDTDNAVMQVSVWGGATSSHYRLLPGEEARFTFEGPAFLSYNYRQLIDPGVRDIKAGKMIHSGGSSDLSQKIDSWASLTNPHDPYNMNWTLTKPVTRIWNTGSLGETTTTTFKNPDDASHPILLRIVRRDDFRFTSYREAYVNEREAREALEERVEALEQRHSE